MSRSIHPLRSPSASRVAIRSGRGIAFSLVELLAVVTIIMIMLVLLLPLSGKLRERANRAECFSNMRSLQAGYNLSVSDRDGQLPSSDTGPAYGLTNSNDWWVSAQRIDVGAVWPYVRSAKAYTCPSYPRPARFFLKRHFSLSVRIGSRAVGVDDALRRYSEVFRPARTHVFIEEYDNRSEAIGPSPGALDGYVVARDGRWVDCPPVWHDMGAQFTYLDGHAEFRSWVGPKMRTVDVYEWFYSQNSQYWPTTPKDTEDWKWMLDGVLNAYPR